MILQITKEAAEKAGPYSDNCGCLVFRAAELAGLPVEYVAGWWIDLVGGGRLDMPPECDPILRDPDDKDPVMQAYQEHFDYATDTFRDTFVPFEIELTEAK